MSDLSLKEKLQPSLLDRLIDDEPDSRVESREKRVIKLPQLREAVLRDLNWLLNTENLESVHDLTDLPNIRGSVLNYGLPSVVGNTQGSLQALAIEERLRETILQYEPRILADSLIIKTVYDTDEYSTNAFCLEIIGDLWAIPIPLKLFLRTEIDLESGNVTVNPTS